MASVSGKDTKPEITIRKSLFAKGFRYRKNDKRYPGKPDIVLPKFKTVILINGCFWHGHKDCKHSTLPSSNISYWHDKITKNITRDEENIRKLQDQGWKVIVVWECEIKTIGKREERIQQLIEEIVDQK